MAGSPTPRRLESVPSYVLSVASLTPAHPSQSLIDLAGSEKATASKERNAEGRHINQSQVVAVFVSTFGLTLHCDRLLTLKNVISKLAEQSAKKTSGHIPYRDSKLFVPLTLK